MQFLTTRSHMFLAAGTSFKPTVIGDVTFCAIVLLVVVYYIFKR